MKLMFCVTCNQVFSLAHARQKCAGGHCGGRYVNDVDAEVWGPKDKMFVLGFQNSSLASALRSQIKEGDSTELMHYAGKPTPVGRVFTAFVVPDAADSVQRHPGPV